MRVPPHRNRCVQATRWGRTDEGLSDADDHEDQRVHRVDDQPARVS
jgi:hypothetical protein